MSYYEPAFTDSSGGYLYSTDTSSFERMIAEIIARNAGFSILLQQAAIPLRTELHHYRRFLKIFSKTCPYFHAGVS
jgi:hypothetical protein